MVVGSVGLSVVLAGIGLTWAILGTQDWENESRLAEVSAGGISTETLPRLPVIYHSEARYLKNMERLRRSIESLDTIDSLQVERAAEVLAWTEVREWEVTGEFEGDLCFQNESNLECVNPAVLEQARSTGESFAIQHPRGVGLCLTWFDDVCMAGDWFSSRSAFADFIGSVGGYVLTGTFSWEQELAQMSDEHILEESPSYEPDVKVTVPLPENGKLYDVEALALLLSHSCWLGSATSSDCSGEELVQVARQVDRLSRAVNPPSECYVILNDVCTPEEQVVPRNWREAEAKCRAETGVGCHGDPRRPEPAEPVWTEPGTPAPEEYVPPQEAGPTYPPSEAPGITYP